MTAPRDFAVPKEKQPVTVHFIGGDVRDGSIFLECYPDARSLHDKLFAFLEDRKDFFPLSSGSGVPDLVNKEAVRMVEVEFPKDEESFEIMHVELVTIIFRDGAQVSGDLLAEVPKEQARLSDSLNLPGNYLCARVYGRICYVNKKAIQKVLSAGT